MIQTQISNVDRATGYAPEIKAFLKEIIQALDPSVSIEIWGEEKQPLFLQSIGHWEAPKMIGQGIEPATICALEIDISGFGSLNNKFGYQTADAILSNTVSDCIRQIEPLLNPSANRLGLIRHGGGTMYMVMHLPSPYDRQRFNEWFSSHKEALEEVLTLPVAPLYQTPGVMAEIAQKAVNKLPISEVFRNDLELALKTEEIAPPKIRLKFMPSPAYNKVSLKEWLTPPKFEPDLNWGDE